MAEKLKKHASKLILGIRGEDIKFDPQNIDVYKDNKMRLLPARCLLTARRRTPHRRLRAAAASLSEEASPGAVL